MVHSGGYLKENISRTKFYIEAERQRDKFIRRQQSNNITKSGRVIKKKKIE